MVELILNSVLPGCVRIIINSLYITKDHQIIPWKLPTSMSYQLQEQFTFNDLIKITEQCASMSTTEYKHIHYVNEGKTYSHMIAVFLKLTFKENMVPYLRKIVIIKVQTFIIPVIVFQKLLKDVFGFKPFKVI